MKKLLLILILLISINSFGQPGKSFYDTLSRIEKNYYESGAILSESRQLAKEFDKQRHIVYYHENGQKSKEFFENNRINYDTLKEWTDKGELYHMAIYKDSTYMNIDYWYETGQISGIGNCQITKIRPAKIIVYDSTTFDEYNSLNGFHVNGEPYNLRIGVWREYHKNGKIENEGEYLPMAFYGTLQMIDSSGVSVTVPKTSFELKPDLLYSGISTYLKNGIWKYYDEKGVKRKEEIYKNGLLIKLTN